MASYAFHTKKIERGDVFYVESIFNEEGSEQKSGRPAIIVSNDKGNEHAPIVSVVYLTTAPKNSQPTHATIRSTPKLSTALCEQIYTVSKTRLGDYMTTCTEAEMDQVDICLEIALALNCEPRVVTKEVVVEKPVEVVKEVYVEKPVEVPAPPVESSELIKVAAERDVYKGMYEQLLKKLMER